MTYPRQYTSRYTTYLQMSIVEALEAVFEAHPDPLLKDTKVRLPNSFQEVDYPLIVVEYHESDIGDAGIGHYEKGFDQVTGRWYKRQRLHYHGNIEFRISAMSSLDRDIIGDSLIQTIMMSNVEVYTSFFLSRIYHQEEFERLKNLPAGTLGTAHYYNYINMGSSLLHPTGNSAVPNPWGAEDALLYQKGYTMAIMGEVLSMPPDITYNLLEKILAYPYVGGIDTLPTGTNDPAPWIPIESD